VKHSTRWQPALGGERFGTFSHKEKRHVTGHQRSCLFWFVFTKMEVGHMKRIVLLVCGLVLVVANTAEARRHRWSNNRNYSWPAAAAQATQQSSPATTAATAEDASDMEDSPDTADAAAATSDSSQSTSSTEVKTVSYSTSTAQGVANLMAANSRVGHWGGNPGCEGCGCGATPAAAYSICCYANSGMATVDVGYAQGRNGMWYCCRRYR